MISMTVSLYVFVDYVSKSESDWIPHSTWFTYKTIQDISSDDAKSFHLIFNIDFILTVFEFSWYWNLR